MQARDICPYLGLILWCDCSSKHNEGYIWERTLLANLAHGLATRRKLAHLLAYSTMDDGIQELCHKLVAVFCWQEVSYLLHFAHQAAQQSLHLEPCHAFGHLKHGRSKQLIAGHMELREIFMAGVYPRKSPYF